MFGLKSLDAYEYLKKSGSTTADGINDATDFNETKVFNINSKAN